MRIMNMISVILILFLLGGCLTANKNKNNKPKNIETYRLDLDNDMVGESVEIENRFATHGDILVRITKPAKRKADEPKIFNFRIAGVVPIENIVWFFLLSYFIEYGI